MSAFQVLIARLQAHADAGQWEEITPNLEIWASLQIGLTQADWSAIPNAERPKVIAQLQQLLQAIDALVTLTEEKRPELAALLQSTQNAVKLRQAYRA
ncbi:hypothetical protein [Andreprevotia chitinilytica]|uniref:hypothetical protein n=1 Tax=Andreprevotia chitinilytica TaxID=396808 RepID=UPI0012EC083A|nr:hypothetical protein [Andreprevotia chitinilytica]